MSGVMDVPCTSSFIDIISIARDDDNTIVGTGQVIIYI